MKNFQANFRLTPWLMATALSVTLAACGGGGQETILGTGDIANVLVAPPTVTVVSPLPGAVNVAPNTTLITAAFSEPMDATTLTQSSFTLSCPDTPEASGGTVTYLAATKVATLSVPATLQPGTCTATVTSAVKDSTGVNLVSNYPWQFTVGDASASDTTKPTVDPVTPAINATNVPTNTVVKALFNEGMDPLTINADSFTLSNVQDGLIPGKVTLGPLNKNATFTPNANLTVGTVYTAKITTASTDLAGNTLENEVTWNFTTAEVATLGTGIDLDTAAPFGTFGGSAGMTNMGINTIVNGDIGTIATSTDSITGFHETGAYGNDIYTETTLNSGAVNGVIYTCTNSVTGANSAGPSAPECAVAKQARLDAETAYLALKGMPAGSDPGAGNLANLTLAPGTYTSESGSFMIQGGDLTLSGDANATWVFQMASTLTVGGPGAAAPQSIILAGGAQAKNVFWQVGTAATINAAGGGTMVGTIIAQDGVTFSTDGNNLFEQIVTLNGRALSLGASVTMVNTVITVPGQ